MTRFEVEQSLFKFRSSHQKKQLAGGFSFRYVTGDDRTHCIITSYESYPITLQASERPHEILELVIQNTILSGGQSDQETGPGSDWTYVGLKHGT